MYPEYPLDDLKANKLLNFKPSTMYRFNPSVAGDILTDTRGYYKTTTPMFSNAVYVAMAPTGHHVFRGTPINEQSGYTQIKPVLFTVNFNKVRLPTLLG